MTNRPAGRPGRYFAALVALIGAITLTSPTARADNADANYPPLAPPEDASEFGRHIQRTMRLLETSTAENPNTVRIMFYGQSVTKQDWWYDVVADLERRFPHANIVAINPAIGGFASQRLIVTTPMDVGGFYPDLVIFHVFGAHNTYEDIIRWIRTHTTAEIALANDHLHARVDPTKEDTGWPAFMNERFLPAVAKVYHCQFTDVRGPWRRYLLRHDLPSQAPLRDGVHLNEHGCWLMAEIVERTLQVRDEPDEPEAAGWVKTHRVGEQIRFEDGKLTLSFTGNRVVALAPPGAGPALRVRVDGKKPSSLPTPYRFTRPGEGPGIDWPWTAGAPTRISSTAQLQPETWTITITEGDRESFRFKLVGSKTGPDGAGSSEERFVSDSRRVIIEPEHWWKSVPRGKESPVKPGYEMTFRSELMGTDRYVPADNADHAGLVETVLVSGLSNGPHTLELTVEGDGRPTLEALRVYEPPLKPSRHDEYVRDVISPHSTGGEDELPKFIFQPM